jgi:hypothetical protein
MVGSARLLPGMDSLPKNGETPGTAQSAERSAAKREKESGNPECRAPSTIVSI